MSSPKIRTFPAVGSKQAEQDRQGRRLAGAVAAEQRRGDAARDAKADPVDRDRGRIALDQIVDFDGGLGHRPYMRHYPLGHRADAGPLHASCQQDPVVTDTSRAPPSEPAARLGRISLRTLVPIRWVAIAGQALTLLTVHYGLGFRCRYCRPLASLPPRRCSTSC